MSATPFIVVFLLAIVNAMLIDNVVLSRFYGICSFIGVSNKVKSAFSMGVAVSVVIVFAALICWPVYYYILVPLHIPFMDTLTYILIIASLVQIVGLFIKKHSPSLYRSFGIYLPLITTNCAVLGVVQSNTDSGILVGQSMANSFGLSMANAIGTSLGYLLIIVVFAFIRVRMEDYASPKAFKGTALALITASLMAMAIMGLMGIGA
jgi:Na+-translocating ferredoxin:NAD+ oxidoreductase subunit A